VNIQENEEITREGKQKTSGKRTTVDMQSTDVDGDGRGQREVRAKLQKKGDVTTQHLKQIQLLGKRKVEGLVDVDDGLDKTYGRDVRSKQQHQFLEGGETEVDIDQNGEKLTQKQVASRHGKNIPDRPLQQKGDIAELPIKYIDKEVDNTGEELTQKQELMGEPNGTGRMDKGGDDEEEMGESVEKEHQASQESQKTTDRLMHNQRVMEEVAENTEENIEQQPNKMQQQASQQKDTNTHDRSMQQQHNNKRGGDVHQQQQQQEQNKDHDNNNSMGNNDSRYKNREKIPLLSKMRDEAREKLAIGGGRRSMDIRGNGTKSMAGINNKGTMGRGDATIIKSGFRGTSIIHITPQHQQQQHTPQHQQQHHNRGDGTTNSRTASYTHDSLLGVVGNSEKRNGNVGMSFAKSTGNMDMNDGKVDQHRKDRRDNLMRNTRNHLIFNEDEGNQHQQSEEEYYYPGGAPAKEKGMKRKSEAALQGDIVEQQHVAEDANKDAAAERGGDKRRRKEKGEGVQKERAHVDRDEEGEEGEGDRDAVTRNRTEGMIGSKDGGPSTQEEEGSEGNDDDGVIGVKAADLGISESTASFLMTWEGEVSKEAFDKCFPFGLDDGVIGVKAADLGISVFTALFLMSKEGEVSKEAFVKRFPFGIESID